MKDKKNTVKSLRFRSSDVELFNLLRKNSIKVDEFIRSAFREKLERDFPNILKQRTKIECPF